MPDQTLPDPNLVPLGLQIFAVWMLPFIAYYLGIYIRKMAFPSAGSPPLTVQFLLAIPVCLIVVSPLIITLQKSLGSHIPTFLFTIGIIIEHGMIMHETAVKHLERLRNPKPVTQK